MAAKLDVAVVTPVKALATSSVDQVTAPSEMGEIGILPGHRALLANLVPGVLELREGTAVERYAISGGFIEVNQDQVKVLAENAETAADVDLERSTEALKDAEAQLKKLTPVDADYAEQSLRAARARARIKVASN